MPLPLIAFSTVPWTAAFRRPQHLLRRLARNRQIFYFEAPRVFSGMQSGVQSLAIGKNLQVLRPHSCWPQAGFNLGQILAIAEEISKFVAEEGIGNCDLWTNTPMIQPLIDCLNPKTLIYDVNYGPEVGRDDIHLWSKLEMEMVSQADFVFASHPMVSRQWGRLGGRFHLLPGGVDIPHFFFQEKSDVVRPQLGFVGTLDHRVEYALVDLVAAEFPACDIKLAGPLTPDGHVAMPRRENISYEGVIEYARLPGFMNSLALGLLPYLNGGSNERNNVAKIGEYYAAGLPVVSTASPLVPHKREAACVAGNHMDFLGWCERMLHQGAGERERRILSGQRAIENCSWDFAADHVDNALNGKLLV